MTKRNLIITSFKLAFLFVLVKINLYNQPSNSTPTSPAELKNIPQLQELVKFDKISHFPSLIEIAVLKKSSKKSFNNQFSFAKEHLPEDNKKFALKMRRILIAHSYRNLQTHQLHYRAQKWFAVIEPILKKYGIPEDFKYLPLVESGLNNNRYSVKGAAGLWQFMPQTARDFGLKVNDDVDQRFDIKLSTIAAARYIKSLHKQFHNWTLVAAAYNAGEGKIKSHIRNQNQRNYFKLKLNPETARYVYSVICMKEIIEHPEDYGYKIPHPKFLAYQR